MANPQVENGFTQISNEIIEALARQIISPDELRCLMAIIRKTWGYHKKADRISLSQFVLATGMTKPHICRALFRLEKKRIIARTGNDYGTLYRIQKDFEIWNSLPKRAIVARTGNKSLPEQAHTKEKIQKKNYLCANFDLFYKSYPKKKARRDAEKAWNKLNPDETLFNAIMKSLEKQKALSEWQKSGGQFVPLPATWINGRRWEDEVSQSRW